MGVNGGTIGSFKCFNGKIPGLQPGKWNSSGGVLSATLKIYVCFVLET